MIKLERPPAPPELTDIWQLEQTNVYKKTKSAVYNKAFIKNALLEMSADKCAFCERMPNNGGGYMEIEHFYPKKLYPNEVVVWTNLLPSCKQCNIKKGQRDTKKAPILNPCLDSPQEHLYFRHGQLIGKTELGVDTIELLKIGSLDDREEICDDLKDRLLEIKDDIKKYSKNPVAQLFVVFKLIQRDKIYTAALATVLLAKKSAYWNIKQYCQDNELWTADLENYEQVAAQFALLPKST